MKESSSFRNGISMKCESRFWFQCDYSCSSNKYVHLFSFCSESFRQRWEQRDWHRRWWTDAFRLVFVMCCTQRSTLATLIYELHTSTKCWRDFTLARSIPPSRQRNVGGTVARSIPRRSAPPPTSTLRNIIAHTGLISNHSPLVWHLIK